MPSENLENLVTIGELERHNATARETAELLGLADQKLADCSAAGLSADSTVSVAHFAVIACARAALAACGYRASSRSHHETSIQSLQFTIGASQSQLSFFIAMMRKRHVGSYSRAGEVAEPEAVEMVRRTRELRQMVEDWLRANYPDLLPNKEPPQ